MHELLSCAVANRDNHQTHDGTFHISNAFGDIVGVPAFWALAASQAALSPLDILFVVSDSMEHNKTRKVSGPSNKCTFNGT